MWKTVLSLAAILLLCSPALAGGGCAVAPCGEAIECCDPVPDCCGACGCRKVCKVVCEVKKIKKHVWVVECEEFCAPWPGCKPCAGPRCGSCGGDGCGDSCGACCGRPIVPPRCGPVRCRKKLVKKEITCEVPVYKCVVVSCGCGDGCWEPAGGGEPEETEPAAPLHPDQTADIPTAPAPPVDGTSLLNSLRLGR
jgi:hypothetical protein